MTTESWPGPEEYTISGTGPYAVGFEYTAGAIAPRVVVDGVETDLSGGDWSLDPASGESGNLTLDAGAAATHDGRTLRIYRETVIEQGWAGQNGREAGLEVQLDRVVQAAQEATWRARRSLRATTAQPPVDFEDGAVPMFKDGVFQNGPTADEITAAQGYATAAANAFADFDVRYLGVKASDPATDNNGDPLIEGALYFNTATNQMRVYNGASWVSYEADAEAAKEAAEGARGAAEVAQAAAEEAQTDAEDAATAAEAAQTAAENARDAAFVNADVYADEATGRAAVADGEQFTVVEGDDLVRYERVDAGASTEVARTPTSSGISDIRSEVTTTSVIGYPSGAIPDGTALAGNSTYVFATPAAKTGRISSVRLFSAASGTVKISTWAKVDDDFTRQSVTSITVAPGYQEITGLNIPISANQHVGFYGNTTVKQATETGEAWFADGGDLASFTDATDATFARLRISFDIDATDRVSNLETDLALKAEQSDVDAIEADIYTTKTLNIGTVGAMVSSGADIDNSLYALEQACQQDGTVSEVRLFTEAAGTVRIMVYSKSEDTFTVEEEVNVAATGGYEAFTISLPILAGQYVGVQGTNVGLQTGVSDTFGWYGANGTNSFTDAAPTRSSRVLAGFTVEYQETSFTGASRPASVDLPWENMLVVGMGQSLWEGSNGDVTTTVEYDNKGFPAYPASPTSIDDATVANTERATSRGEWPGLGAASAIRAALLRDNNLSYEDVRSTVVVANNAVGGKRIDEIDKGNAQFASAVAQAGALAGITGESSGVLGVTFGQGESDSIALTDPATYLADLIQLAEDADADLRAATGQSKRIPLVTYQMNSTGRDIGLMHLQASIDSPLIYCAGPMYQYEYYDTLHINAASSRLVGALHGEVIKRVAIDGEEWEPLRPIDAKVLGNAITLTFNKSRLVLDSTSLPGQTDSGFVVKNDSDVSQTISAVDVINGNQVRLTCATTPASEWVVEYGVSASGRSDAFVGKMGNLRDNAGAERIFDTEPIHNWCVVFDWEL